MMHGCCQTVGMTRDVLALKGVQAMYASARTVLGYDLQQLVLEGPAARLEETVVAQPALLVAGLAALEKLKLDDTNALARSPDPFISSFLFILNSFLIFLIYFYFNACPAAEPWPG